MNAQWWVRYTNARTGQRELISLASPDLKNPREAHRRARKTAKERLARRGIKATALTSQCVG